GILNFIIVVLSDETRGQAETVYLGLKNIIDKVDVLTEEVYVFNIDSYRHHFKKPNISKKCDGYIEVFQGEGDHWSFIEINDSGKVIRTTEKERISNLCSDGLYFFKNVKDRKSTRLNSSHVKISYAVFCLKKKIILI